MSSSDQPLTKLIGKAAWKNVLARLKEDPEQGKKPITTVTWASSTAVFPLHQAVCRKSTKPMPCCVLEALIESNPEALDYYAFLGACENERISTDIINTLFSKASHLTLMTVQTKANHLVLAALGNDNADVVGILCNKYPHLLKDDILYQSCKKGLPKSTEAILISIQNHKMGIVESLMNRHNGSESALEVVSRLFDMKDEDRFATLSICTRYASASRSETGSSDMTGSAYPLIVAAIGWVPQQVYEEILLSQSKDNAAPPKGKSGFVQTCALKKAMHMVYEKPDFDQIPDVFKSPGLISACRNQSLDNVQNILQRGDDNDAADAENNGFGLTNLRVSRKGLNNALDIAIQKFEENECCKQSSEILSTCLKYINAKNMKLEFIKEQSNYDYEYPTPFAAIGLVPTQVLHRLFSIYKDEIRTKIIGKLAIKKLLFLGIGGGELDNYATRFENRKQGSRRKLFEDRQPALSTINEKSSSVSQ